MNVSVLEDHLQAFSSAIFRVCGASRDLSKSAFCTASCTGPHSWWIVKVNIRAVKYCTTAMTSTSSCRDGGCFKCAVKLRQ